MGHRVADGTLPVWTGIVAIGAATAALMSAAGLHLDWASLRTPLSACLVLVALGHVYRHWRPDARLAATLTAGAQVIAFTAVGEILSYTVAARPSPLWDTRFLAWDRALGLDWMGYLAFVDAHPALGEVFRIAYLTLIPQTLAVVVILGFSARVRQLERFILAFVLAAVTTILVSGMLPADGTYALFRLEPVDFPHLNPSAAYLHIEALHALRAGTLRVVSLDDARGLITFPSFHAALGMLLILAMWPARRLRWLVAVLNVLLILATPIEGGHYFVDVIAGIAIAVASFGLVWGVQRLQVPQPEIRFARSGPSRRDRPDGQRDIVASSATSAPA